MSETSSPWSLRDTGVTASRALEARKAGVVRGFALRADRGPVHGRVRSDPARRAGPTSGCSIVSDRALDAGGLVGAWAFAPSAKVALA